MKETMKTAKKTIWILLAILFITPGLFSQTVGITGDSTINQCETKTYTITILNNSGNPLTNLAITALLQNFTGFSYVSGTTGIDVNGGGVFCTADPQISSGYSGTCLPAPAAPYLVWDIDALCPGSPFTLNNGDTLDIIFDLATDCSAVSGSLNTYIDYRISGTPFCDDTGAHSIQVLPGGVTIKKAPNVIPQELWQNVTWTLTIENTGFGIIENVVVTDVLGAGLAYISSSPAGSNAGQTTTWDALQVPGFASMNPGDIITLDITAQVIACEFLENNADVRWGCDMVTDCYNTAATLPPSTATASVQRIVKTPLLDYTPPNVSFNYCEDYVDVNFTVSNTGDGRAHDVWLLVDFGSLSVSNISAGAIYNNIDKRFELTNPLAAAPGPGNTYDLGFRLNFTTWCGGGFPSGDLLWQTVYKDDCDNEFYPPVKLSTINSPANSSSLAVGKTGAPTAVQIGDQITYNITSSYSGPLSCGSGPGSTTDITVIDTLPDGFSVVNNGGGIYVPGGGGTGGTITWTYTPPASLNTNITIQAPSAADCETYCFTTFTNNIQATSTDCCGCALSASASQTTAIECEELVDSEKTAVPTTDIRCDTIQYTNTYVFADNASLDTVDLSQLVFREDADSEQEYDTGSLAVTLSGFGDITACALPGLTDTTSGAGGNLSINFSNCNTYGSIRNRTLTITYRLTITETTVGACSSTTFYSWSALDLNLTTGSECLPDGIIYETTVVSVDPPAMSLSITGLGQIIHQCETQTITMTLSQTSDTADPKDVRLVLSGLNYYVVNPAATVCSGAVAPTSCIPAIIGDDYVWYFADGFTGSGQSATLQLDIQKRCSGSGDLVATAYFDDNCNDDGSYDDTCSVSGTETPALLLSGDLLIEKNPEVVYASVNTIQWKIYLTNRGSGTAFNVWFDDELGSGLDYVSAVVDNMTGVTVTADQDHEGAAINGCTIAITQMAAGERREITFNALLVDCSNLTNDVSASWGCVGVECQTEVSDSATVEIPRPLLINTNVVTTPADACSDPAGSITLRNAGQTTCYNLQITETLPAGLSYIPGSTRWQVNGAGWNGPNAAYDPNPTASPLQWTSTEIPGLAQSDPGDTIQIEFDMEADCPFSGGNVTVGTSYENPCGQVFNTANSVFTVAFREPQVTVTKTRVDEPIDCGDLVEWTITVQNTSGYTLPIIWVEDTLGSSYTYQSSVGDPPFTSDNGTFDGTNTVSWELRNVNHNDTVNLTLRATADNPPCSVSLDNTVIAWWGCGTSDGSSATKPGVNPPDNSLCLTTTGVSDTNTPTREPTIGFLDISLNPVSIDSCNDNTQLTVTIQNTGPTDAENVDLVITLPAGITYNAGSSTVTCGGVSSPAADPTISGNRLIYYDITDNAAGKANNICDTVQAAGGNDTLVLVFSVHSECYETYDVRFELYYYDCCEDNQYFTTDSETLTSLFPDLSVSKTPVNSQVDCSANQTWAITVTNNGSGNAQVVRIEDTLGDWIDYVSSAPAATAMGGQVYGWEINNLAAGGGSQSFTITGQLNPDAPQADCTALLRQNNVRAIWGCGIAGDAVDNDPTTGAYDCTHHTWANAPAATLQMPDLVVTAITPVINCMSEGNFSGSITITVQNQGNGNSVNNFTVEITDGKGWTGTGTYGANVAPGASVAVTIDVTGWAPDCQPCAAPYTFNVTNVDLGDAVCECNERNNTFGPVTYLTPIPDLEVDSDTLSITCVADGQYRVAGNVTLRNAGCAGTLTQDVPMRFTLLSGGGCGGAQVAQWTQTFTGVNIPAGATQTFAITNYTVVGDACGSASGCQFSIRTEADYSDTICECDGTDNTLCSDKTFSIPDLRVDSETLTISCSADGQFRIQGNLTIANDGCGANLVSNIPIRLRVYNNNGACSGANGLINFTQTGVNIPAGGTQTFPVNRTLNRNLCTNSTGCQVAVGIELDYANVICECTNTNNNYCAPNKTVPIPDLQVTGDTLNVTCLQDGQVRISGDVTVANTGCNAAVAGNVPVRFTLFSNINCGGSQLDQWTETFAGANITAGSSQVFTLANRDIITNICSNSTGCQVSLRIEADPTTVICECSGGNNTRCSNKTVSVPDLRITSVTPAVTCNSDGNLSGTVQVTVNNNGCGTAINIPVRLTSDCGYSFTDQTVGSLAAGSSTNLTFTYAPVCTACTCTFTAAADPDNIICECGGTNNSLTSAPFTMTVPDIEVRSDTLAISCASDSQVTLSGTVTLVNNGCGANLTTDVPMRFTLFDNTGCAGNQLSQWTQTFTSVNLASGGGTQVFTLTPQTINSDLCANSFNCQISIRVEADYSSSICECDGTDNTYCADNKTVDIPDLEVQSDNLGVTCFSDGQVTVSGTITMTNSGCGSNLTANVPVRFTLFNNTGCGGNQLLQWTETFAGVNIPSDGGIQTFTLSPQNLTANLVANSTNCRVSIFVEVDYTDSICESDGTDNTYCADNKNVDIPDIEMAGDTLSVDCLSDGQVSISGTVTIANSGCGSNLNTNIPVRFTLYDNTGCIGNQLSQWTETLNGVNIPSGGSTQAFTITPHNITTDMVDNSTSCQVSIRMEADYSGTICESDGTDNTSCSDKSISIPDLTVNSVTAAASCIADGNVQGTVTVNVGNTGCAAANNAVVGLTSDCGLVFADQTVNINAGASTNVTFNFTPTAANCTCVFTATIDPTDAICESDGTNNTAASAPNTLNIPDIEVQADSLAVNCLNDGQVTLSGTVTLINTGCGANLTNDIPVRFTLYDNTGCAGNQLNQWTENLTGVSMPSGGGTQVFTITPQTVTTNLVTNSAGCQVSIMVEADYPGTVCEFDGSDNTYCADNKAVDIPDLEVQADTLAVNCFDDGQVTISGTVTMVNNGCGSNLTDNVPVRFTLFDNTGCGGNQLLQWTETFAGVNIPSGGGIQTFTLSPQNLTANIVDNCSNCRVSIRVETDYTNSICESDGTDNTYCADDINIDIPDIEVQSENLAISCTDDGQYGVSGSVTMNNNGCGSNLTGNVAVRFTVFNNPDCGGDQVVQWTETFSAVNIPAGGGSQVFPIAVQNFTGNLCNNSSDCRLSILIETDYTNTICESDGTDNNFCANKILEFPDLTIGAVATSITCLADGSLTGTNVTVRNAGCGAATGVVVRLTSDCGLTFTEQTVDLVSGESRDLIFPFTSGITTCSCHFTAVIDPDNIICECNGTDNTRNSTTSMRIPDIEVQNESLLISCLDDGVISVSGTVTLVNNGCGLELIDNVNMRFSLFDSTGCGGNLVHRWTSTFTGVSIPAAGGTQTFTIQPHNITTNFCTNSSGCQVSLLIEADYNDSICEWDGTDNTYCTDKTSDCIDAAAASAAVDTRCRADGNITGTIRVNVNNSGGNPITQDFSIRVDDGAGWSSELRYNADLGGILPLPAGDSSEVTFEWDRNFTNRNCTFNNINVLIDSQNEICQCTTANDTLMTTYRLDYPNLLPTAITANCSKDGAYIVQVTVENNGCGRAGNFTLNLTDNHGSSRDIVIEGLNEGESKTVDFLQWPALCEANSVGFTARVDSKNDVCELDDRDQILEYLLPGALPDLIMGDIGWVCNPDGTITFTIEVSNQGEDSANNVPVTVTDNNNNVLFNRTVNLPAGASEQLSFTTAPFAKNIDHTFRFVVDGAQNICECDGSNNEKSIIVNCPGGEDESPLQLEKTCPPGQQPGGLFRFELRIKNSGPTDLVDVTIEDFLPEGFRYVSGSSALDGQTVPDPQIGDSLTWQIAKLQPGQTSTLIFSAVADADIDPGRYCNEAKGSASVPGSTVTINSPKVQCCTVVSRETAAGCCLDVEEWPMGFFHKPEGPISFIEPYFQTESAMYTAYAIFNLWKNTPLRKEGMPLFMKERLQNYARSTVEEFYFNSRSGIALPDGTLKLSFAGSYPEQDEKSPEKQGWVRKQVDQTMTLSQLGFELLALNETRKVETEKDLQQKLDIIIKSKLDFLNGFMTDLPHGWEIKEKNNNRDQEEIKKLTEKASLYDKASLYLAMVELSKNGNEKANDYARQLRGMLKTLDNRDFDPRNLRAELIFILTLLENEESGLAERKAMAFETIYKKRTGNSQAGDGKENEMLTNLHDYALTAAVNYKTGGSLYPELMKRMKEKYYLNDMGIFADKQPDFTFKLTLRSLASLILCFDTKTKDINLDHNATILYRTFDEVGLFLKKRNLVIGKPLYSLLKNYPFTEPLLPVLPFTKAKPSVAPVFSQDAVVHSTRVKPIGENLIPHDFSKILSPSYETRSSRIAAISFGLQYFGDDLMKSSLRVIKEEGRSLKYTGRKYLDSLLQSGAGVLFNGITLLPFEHIAIKGPGREKQNLEPIDSGVTFSTETLANYLLAENSYLRNQGAGVGEYAGILPGLQAEQVRIVEKFADVGYIPLTFKLFVKNGASSPSYTLIPSRERASKITTAKLYHALRSEKIGGFLETLLKKMTEGSDPGTDDLVFLLAVPELLPYFKEEISNLIDLKDSNISLNSADIIGRRLLGQSQTDEMKKSLENLHKNWDKDAVLPKSDRIENIEKGLIYHHEPRALLLYLVAINNPEDFRFKRTLNFFTYLLENEWGVAGQKSFMTLPSAKYLVFREEPRQNAEPGDLVNFKVRVDNTCPEGFGSARDIPELFLRSRFTPPLIYTGTQPVDGLFSIGDFRWRYNGFPEGTVLEYIYQAYIPADFRHDYIDGSIYAGGRQGFQDFGIDSAAGDNCEDIHQVGRLHFVPLTPLNGLVFEDRNVNGVKDVGEPGIPNILIKDTRGRLFRSDADGRFIVMAGDSYEGVQIELKSLPANYLLTTTPTQLVNRHFAGDIYFALVPTIRVTGFVYCDDNGNGIYDNAETRPPGVLLQAKDKEVLTAENGQFIFRNLPELWQQWIKIKPEQPYYNGDTGSLRFFIPEN